MVAGPDGNMWVTLSGGAYPPARSRPSAIARVTPNGEMTLFKAGLRKGSVPGGIVAGADGDLWFTDTAYQQEPEVGRITPEGTIAEFPTGVKEPLGLSGLAAAPDGNVWFTEGFTLPHGDHEPGALIGRLTPEGALSSFGASPAALGAPIVGPDGNVWFVGDTGKVTIDRVTPSGEISQFDSPTLGVPSHLVAGTDGNVWFTAHQSIGRITPSGEITSFTDCMDYRQFFSETTSIVAAPGGDLWFTSVTSRMLPSMGEPPTIGRVTPSGEITLFKAGVRSQPNSIVAGPDGRIYFTGGGEEIERITPPSAPVNTFIFGPGRATAKGAANLTVEVPGPGRFELRPLALLLPGKRTARLSGTPVVRAAAATCGPTSLRFGLRGAARTKVRHGQAVKLKVKATYTPTGGSPNSQVETVLLRKPKHRR
jgi:virginiamycin B lyase